MQQDKVIAYNDNGNYTTAYFGGSLSVVRKDNQWYKIQYPSNNASISSYDQVPAGICTTDYKNIFKLDDEYYLVIDEYGVFLHTYDMGDAEELPLVTKY